MRRLLVRLAQLASVLLAIASIALVWLLWPRPKVEVVAGDVPHVANALEFRDARLAESRAAEVPPSNTEKLVLHRSGGSEVVFLYIHGFSASRGEGELVVDTLAREWSANAWYLRLPGHGGPGQGLADSPAQDYFDTVTQALGMARRLGDKTVVIATSTGASLAIWAAATHPEYVDAIILASPLVDYADPTVSLLLSSHQAEWIGHQVLGEIRDVRWVKDPQKRKVSGYDDRWTWRYPTRALINLEDVRRITAEPELQSKVGQPSLMLVYDKDPENRDPTVSVDAAEDAFSRFNGGEPHADSRLVRIEDGAHVLMSEYVRTDKDAVISSMRDFLRVVVGLPPRERALYGQQAESDR